MPDENTEQDAGRKPFRIRIPGFVHDEDIGLGQAIKYVTGRAGIKPCGGCERRAAALDHRVVLSPRNHR